MSSKESTTTNSSDGGGTHHSSNSYSNHHHTRENRESVSRSLRSSTLPPSDRNNINNMNNSMIGGDHRGSVIPLRNKESLFLKESLRHNNKPGGSITMAQSIRSRSSGDGSSIGSSQSQRPMTVTYKSKTTTGMLFSKKTTSVDCGRFIKEPDGEIQMATGEWIHDYLNRNGNGVKRNKSINNGQRLYVATQQGMQNLPPPPMQNLQQSANHDSKKSIKRSWTISNPSGTPGPQMTQRNNNKYYTQSGESFTTSKNGEDNIPPPKIAPPVFLSVPPPPPVAPQNGPPVPPSRTRPPPGYMTGGPPRRNAPVRSHSMSIADVNRFYGSPPLPRFRPPPPPGGGQRAGRLSKGVEITEVAADSGSENEVLDNNLDNKSRMQKNNIGQKPKKHFIHHNNQVIVEDIMTTGNRATDHLDFGGKKYKTLDPTYKVRSHHMEQVANNYNSLERGTRRKLPDIPPNSSANIFHHHGMNTQSLPRPPKHHYREQSDSRSRERLEKSRSHSSEETETNRRQLPKKPQRQSNIRDDREPTPDYDSTGDKSTDKSPLATSPIKKSPNQLEQSGGSSDNQTRATPAGQVKTTTTTTTTTPGENTSSTSSSTNTLAGANSSAAKNQNNSKRKREKLLQTESNDFKLVFISSGDSSKDSDQLNSSLENAGAADTSLPSANGEFIGDMEYEDELTVTNGSNSGSNHNTEQSPPSLPPKTRQVPLNNKNLNINHEFNRGLDRMSISTSGTSIRTAATRDRHSPLLRSPRIPTVRRIPVQKAPSMDDRSITELSIHDMQMVMMHPDASTSSFLSRSLSESDLSEISPIGGASGSGTQSPVQMMAPSDDDNDSTGKELVRQGHLRSAIGGSSHLVQAGHVGHHSGGGGGVGHHHHQQHRRALPPAPVLPQSLRPVAPSIQHYNSSGNSSTTSSNSYYQTKQHQSSSTGGNSPDVPLAATSSYVDQLVKRSASSVNAKNRAPIAKPVRRSKSQRVVNPMQNFVTSIQHGGSVTLVSLNGDPHSGSNSNSTSESEIKHVHHHHFVQGWDHPSGGGPVQPQAGLVQQQQHHQGMSQTLPRKGSKKVEVKPSAHDDSDVVIKKQGLNGVKIRLNLNQIEQQSIHSHPQSYSGSVGDSNSSSSNTSKDGDIDLNSPPVTHLDEVSDHYYLNSDRGGNQNKKRKYTLEELEVEGIATPTEESLSDASGTKSSEFEEEEEVDLNSLIEGDVDEDDDDMPTPLGDIITDVDNINTKSDGDSEDKMDLGSDPTNSTTSSSNRQMIRRIDEDEDDFEEDFSDLEEPELVHLNARAQGISDTEADFLDSAGGVGIGLTSLDHHHQNPTSTSIVGAADRNQDLDNITEDFKQAAAPPSLTTATILQSTTSASSDTSLFARPASPKQVAENSTKEVHRRVSSVSNVGEENRSHSSSSTSSSSNNNRGNFTIFSSSPQDKIDLIQDSSNISTNNSGGVTTTTKKKSKKSSVSQLIAKFESAENVNKLVSSEAAAGQAAVPVSSTSGQSKTPLRSTRSVTPEKVNKPQAVSPRPKSAVEPTIFEAEEDHSNNVDQQQHQDQFEEQNADKNISSSNGNANDIDNNVDVTDQDKADSELPLGAEALTEEELDEMTRRNGYTSYVLIGAAPNDDTASIHSGSGSVGSGNRVVVNVNKGVVLQDGRASNISIVSTESSDLGSPPTGEDHHLNGPAVIPDIPAKIRSRNGILDPSAGPDMQYFLAREGPRSGDYGQRSRGGEQDYEHDLVDDLGSYYTSALESGGVPPPTGPAGVGGPGSRRGRPPVIRAADRMRRQQHPNDLPYDAHGEGEIMVEYDDVYPEDQYDELDPDQEPHHGHHHHQQDNFHITEVNGDHHYEVYEDEYDVRYEFEEHSGDEQYVDNQDYPMCQPVQYDSEEYISEGDDYFDREEELRGYNRQIDFTLHTILEESCEDSDALSERARSGMGQAGSLDQQKRSNKRHSDPSEMEKYFLYGVGGEMDEEEYNHSSGSCSPDEVIEDDLAPHDQQHHQLEHHHDLDQQQPQSLIMLSDQQNTDDSGSVGSESDGQRTPDPKNKKKSKSKSKGSSRMSSDMSENNSDEDSSSNKADNNSSGSMKRNKKRRGSASDLEVRKHLDQQQYPGAGPTSGSSNPPPSASMTKTSDQQQASPSHSLSPKQSPPITPLPREIIEVQPANISALQEHIHKNNNHRASPGTSSSAEDPKSISPTNPDRSVIRKHKSRDSGFVGSTDDLIHTNNLQGGGNSGQVSSDSGQSISDGENAKNNFMISKRLEKVSEVSGEDDEHESVLMKKNKQQFVADHADRAGVSSDKTILSRKDSFNNWSSDEDTNLMMNRMRAFFRSFLMQAGGQGNTTTTTTKDKNIINNQYSSTENNKPPQLVAFEAKLTKMMKTVPGINDEQVKELVEYLSSEDTWSDSYDSSDYTSSDIEVYGINVNNIKNEDLENGEELQKETALMYSKLMMAKMQHSQSEMMKSPPDIEAEIMAHISSKLVALMHEVHSSASSAEEASGPGSSASRTGSFDKRRSPAVAGGGQGGPPSRRYRPPPPANQLSKSVEVLDRSLDMDSGNNSGGRSNSELNVWQGANRGGSSDNSMANMASAAHGVHLSSISHPRRGSLGQVSGSGSIGSTDLLNDDERWSWKGSFESALAIEAKKKEDEHQQQQVHYSQQQQQPQRVTSARFKPSMVQDHGPSEDTNKAGGSKNYSTSSLPRLGTSSIKKHQPPPTIETSEATLELSVPKKVSSNIATTANNPPRSARYRPHGYRPPPTRKNSSPSSRKNSVDSISKYTDDAASDFSSKSGTPSPILGGPRVPHGVIASRDLVRDFRESSVHSRTSSHGGDPEEFSNREESIPRDDLSQRHPSPFNRNSTSSLGSRSESMASVYSADGGRYGTVNVKGEVEFGLIYNLHTGSLELMIKQCKDLAAVDTKRNRSDPYVKVYLLPDKSKSGKRKTKVKKHTLNPVFEESLKFQMPLEEVERRTLWLTVWHSDMFGRNDFLGEVMLPINTIPLDDPQPRWFSLQDRTEPLSEELAQNSTSYRGEIIVALKFVPPNAIGSPNKKLGRRNSNSKGTLLILVKEAKNLVSPKGIPDPFSKGYLLPEKAKGAKHKTGVCRKTVCPKWEHTMTWDDISLDALFDRSLELTVWDHDRLSHNEILGGVRFNLGTGSYQGHPAPWMDAIGGEVTLWQQMLERPNFWVEGSVPLRTAEKLAMGNA